jgi:hypothetical protein
VLTAVLDASRRYAVPCGHPLDGHEHDGFGTRRSGRRSGPLQPDKAASKVVFGLADPRPVTVGGGVAGRGAWSGSSRLGAPWDEGLPGAKRSKRAARNDDSGRVLVTCRLATAHSGPPGRPPIRPNGGKDTKVSKLSGSAEVSETPWFSLHAHSVRVANGSAD